MIPDTWTLKTGKNFAIYFNEHNQFAHRHNFPIPGKGVAQSIKNDEEEEPKKVSKKVVKKELPESDLAEAFVEVLENPGDEEASKQAQIALIRSLTPIIEQGGGGATNAAKIAGDIIGEMFKSVKPPGPGEKCRLCGRLDKPPVVRISKALAESRWRGEGLS
jgi:hypothetical protein